LLIREELVAWWNLGSTARIVLRKEAGSRNVIGSQFETKSDRDEQLLPSVDRTDFVLDTPLSGVHGVPVSYTQYTRSVFSI